MTTQQGLDVHFQMNGRPEELHVQPHELLLDVLRERLGLTGAKRSCDLQVCGTCTVLLDGRAVSACTTLALEMDGAEVTTIEGLASTGALHPLQDAFLRHGALQCGFCTPGMILTCTAMLSEQPDIEPEGIREHLEGNVCRCTGYAGIVAAVTEVARAGSQNPATTPNQENHQ